MFSLANWNFLCLFAIFTCLCMCTCPVGLCVFVCLWFYVRACQCVGVWVCARLCVHPRAKISLVSLSFSLSLKWTSEHIESKSYKLRKGIFGDINSINNFIFHKKKVLWDGVDSTHRPYSPWTLATKFTVVLSIPLYTSFFENVFMWFFSFSLNLKTASDFADFPRHRFRIFYICFLSDRYE